MEIVAYCSEDIFEKTVVVADENTVAIKELKLVS